MSENHAQKSGSTFHREVPIILSGECASLVLRESPLMMDIG
jgi:hypothetical protein